MNNDRRKRLAAVAKQIDELPDLDEIKAELESIRDDEQEAYDAMPESLQQGERGQASEAAISAMENAIDALDQFDPSSIVGDLDEAQLGDAFQARAVALRVEPSFTVSTASPLPSLSQGEIAWLSR